MDNVIIYDAISGVDGKADTLISQTEYNGGGINSLKTDMTAVKADLDVLKNKGVVKSGQNGEVDREVGAETFTIPISTVDPNKTLLFHDFYTTSSGNFKPSVGSVKLNPTNITLTTVYNGPIYSGEIHGTWRLIELY